MKIVGNLHFNENNLIAHLLKPRETAPAYVSKNLLPKHDQQIHTQRLMGANWRLFDLLFHYITGCAFLIGD